MFRWVNHDFQQLQSFDTELLLCFQHNRLIAAIFHPISHAIVAFFNFSISDNFKDKSEQLNSFSSLITQENLFQKRYKSVKVVLYHQHHTLVPSDFFDSQSASFYFDKIAEKSDAEMILYDYIKALDSFNIYAADRLWIKKLNEWFHQVKIYDANSVIIQNILRENKGTRDIKIWALRENNFLYLFVLEHGKLILNNTFSVSNHEEVIYYILAASQQLRFNINHVHVVFSGDFDAETIANQYGDYFENYITDTPPKGIILSDSIVSKIGFHHHALLALAICE